MIKFGKSSGPKKLTEPDMKAVEQGLGKRESITASEMVERFPSSRATFDKTAYQREYMRKRRAAAKAAKEQG